MGDEAKPLKTFERMPAAAPTGGFLHVGTPEQVAAQQASYSTLSNLLARICLLLRILLQ